VLKSDAPQEQKSEACIALSVHGTVEAVPVLAAMLTDEKMSHMARYALEPMPFPEAGAALRDALGKTTGRLQVGVINSLAVRKDLDAVPAIVKLLSSAEADVALGVIGQPEGMEAEQKAIADPALPPANLLGFCHALLICAENDPNMASALYNFVLLAPNAPAQSRAAALRGKILILAGTSDPLLADSLKAEDKATFNAAVRAARLLAPSEAVTSQLAGVLPSVAAERKIVIMQVLGERGDAAAGPALMVEAKEGAVETRVAALNALTRIKYAPVLDIMKDLVLNEDAALAKAARDGIAYFPGEEGNGVLRAMLESSQPEARRLAVELVGEGGLAAPVAVLMKAADDQDESVRIAALKGLQDAAGAEQVPALLERLLKNGSPGEMQATEKALQALSGRLKRAKDPGSATSPLVEGLVQALGKTNGEARLAVLRLLGSTGAPKALEVVMAATSSSDAAVKDTALRTLFDWPNADALPTVMDLANTSTDETLKVLATRGAVRLIGQSGLSNVQRLEHIAALMQYAATADQKKTVVGGLAEVYSVEAFEQALRLLSDETVRAEAIQALRAIARNLGGDAREETGLLNGTDLTGWQGHMEYWRFEDGAIVGESKEKLERNNFLWPAVEVGNFYLAVDVKLEPVTGNGGIQFRSKKVDDYGQALGYQADLGQDVWGRLYHEHGRGKLDWSDRADSAVKPGDWNHYEILAVGPAIWLVVNGKLGAACLDFDGERTGLIGVQLHGGPPQKIQYKIKKLVHNPKVEIESISTEEMIKALKPPEKQ
jgi:HEAT repeat protein